MIEPLLFAAGTAVAVLLIDLLIPRWRAPYLVALIGAGLTGVVSAVGRTESMGQSLLCASESDLSRGDAITLTDCSYIFDSTAQLVSVAIVALTVVAVLLYGPLLRRGDAPPGESMFLLTAALTGGVALAGAGDLVTLIVALETLTLPLYALVALNRRRASAAAEASVTFFVTSVVATAVSLLGAALIYLAAGTVYIRGDVTTAFLADPQSPALVAVGLVLLLAGLGFKVAAVPLHLWAPKTYDGAPLPVAAYLSTASKLGGVVAILIVVHAALRAPGAGINVPLLTGGTLGLLAIGSMVVGTLGALRQHRTVRLLAWSSVAQAGFILAPLAGLAGGVRVLEANELIRASLAYTLFFLVLEIGAFSAVAALRGDQPGGGSLADLAGLGRTAPWRSLGLVAALVGLAGLPPALAGLFAKVTVVRALLEADAAAVAVLVALISVVGLAVYWRPAVALYRTEGEAVVPAPAPSLVAVGVPEEAAPSAPTATVAAVEPETSPPRALAGPAIALAAATLVALTFSLFPQLVFDLIDGFAR